MEIAPAISSTASSPLRTDVNGFLLYPSMQIYTQEGKLLFSIKGESQLTEFIPIANADLLDGNRPQESPADMKRRLRSNAQLKARNIPYMEQLPCEVLESKVQMRSREEMVERAAALFAVAVYSEVILSEDADREKALFYFNKMNDLYGAKSYLTTKETAYINDPKPDGKPGIQFVWRYECCASAALGGRCCRRHLLSVRNCRCAVLAAIFWQHKGLQDLLSKGYSRPEKEILDEADLTLRYDWACVDARIHGKKLRPESTAES